MKRTATTAAPPSPVAVERLDSVLTVNPSTLGNDGKMLAFHIAASRFPAAAARAAALRDEDEYFSGDADAAVQEACRIDPSSVKGAAGKEAVEVLGLEAFRLSTERLYIEEYVDYSNGGRTEGVRVVESHPTLTSFGSQQRHFFPKAKLLALAEAGPTGDDDEFVTVKIKIGKGGWQHFKCRKGDAAGMQGF